jgi:hypothetical protein
MPENTPKMGPRREKIKSDSTFFFFFQSYCINTVSMLGPRRAWSLSLRLYALCHVFHFFSLLLDAQVLSLSGASGIAPLADTLRIISDAELSVIGRIHRFPSVFLITGGSDSAQIFVCLASFFVAVSLVLDTRRLVRARVVWLAAAVLSFAALDGLFYA